MAGSSSLGKAGVIIEAPGAAPLARRLQRWGTAIEDAKPAFEQMRGYMNRGEGEVFDTQGSALGSSWPAPAAPELKVDPRLLVATGALRASLASQTSDSKWEASSTELRFGTSVPYGHLHETGVDGRLPARPFMGMPSEYAKELVNIMHRYSVQVAEGGEGML